MASDSSPDPSAGPALGAGPPASPDAASEPRAAIAARALDATPSAPFLIVGVTSDGRPFRPSDWADRLAGVMSGFQPPGSGPRTRLQYSPYAVPGVHAAHRCVRVDPAIAQVEPMALAFLLNFARDNDLQLVVTSEVA